MQDAIVLFAVVVLVGALGGCGSVRDSGGHPHGGPFAGPSPHPPVAHHHHHHPPQPHRHHGNGPRHHHPAVHRNAEHLVISHCRWRDPTPAACGSVPPASSCHAPDGGVVEDLSCTPGAIDPRVTQANIHRTICVPGYSTDMRPPESYTAGLEPRLIRAYGLRFGPASSELDHLVSLELGGAPADIRNLWPETYAGKRGATDKDELENRLHDEVCNGQISLARAQYEIVHWVRFQPAAARSANPPVSASSVVGGTGGHSRCTPGYDPCIPPGPDVDCAGGGGDGPRYVQGPVRVRGTDPYMLDENGDGVGCD